MSASMAAGVKANFGTMTKSLHVGHAVRDGLLCAKLAAGGFTANTAALEAKQGFLDVYNGLGNHDAAAIVANMGEGLEINTVTNPIKAYPCCASTHSAIIGAVQIRQAHAVRHADVAQVHVVVDKNRMPHTNRPHLQEALSGKFSLQYVVARALLEGRVVLEHFEGDAHRNPQVLSMMERVEVSAAPPGGAPNSFAADVAVVTEAGDTFRATTDRPPADGDDAGLDPPQLWEKFVDCASRVLPAAQVEVLVESLQGFTGDADVREFMRLGEVSVAQRLVVAVK